jgi:hypothetical protein
MIVLSFVTFGIYNIVWFARRRNEMVKNYNVSIPDWQWLIGPWLLSMATLLILVFIQATSPSLAGIVIIFIAMMIASVTVSVFFFWWVWHFGKAAEKITQGRITLIWVILYVLLLGGCIQYVLQYYFNRLPKSGAATTKKYQPSKRFVRYSIAAIIVLNVIGVGVGIVIGMMGSYPQAIVQDKPDAKYLESNRLLREYYSCMDKLDTDFPGEITQGPQEEAYKKAFNNCEAIRTKQNAAADEYNASIAQ